MSQYLVVIVLGFIAVGAVLFPVLVGRERYHTDAELDADVERYREALRDGTLCPHCREPHAPSSRFCPDCGRELV